MELKNCIGLEVYLPHPILGGDKIRGLVIAISNNFVLIHFPGATGLHSGNHTFMGSITGGSLPHPSSTDCWWYSEEILNSRFINHEIKTYSVWN